MSSLGIHYPAVLVLLTSLAFSALGDSVQASDLRRTAVVVAVNSAKGSVVNIHGQKIVRNDDKYSSDSTKRVNGMGTGVVVDGRGYILTNFHVVEGVRRIRVTLANGEAYIARLVAHDPSTDLAVIKIPIKYRMPVIKVGSSRDIMTGESVIAMGNAYGYEHTVTTGIVSAQHRNVKVNETQSYKNLIQTDASINPGNSGGPLLNIDGDMIGINVAVRVGAQGIGFAIPVDVGMQVAGRLMSIERISGLWHGVVHEDESVGNQPRLVVREVESGSPAFRAGVRQGDVIRLVAGHRIGRGIDFECALIGTEVGDPISFTVERNDQPLDLQLGLAMTPLSRKQIDARQPARQLVNDAAWDVLGLRLAKLTKTELEGQSASFRGGLKVHELDRNGLASRLGIRADDVLVGVHIWETVSMDNLNYIIKEADFGKHDKVPFYVLRNGKTLSGNLEVDDLTSVEVAGR